MNQTMQYISYHNKTSHHITSYQMKPKPNHKLTISNSNPPRIKSRRKDKRQYTKTSTECRDPSKVPDMVKSRSSNWLQCIRIGEQSNQNDESKSLSLEIPQWATRSLDSSTPLYCVMDDVGVVVLL